MAEDRQETKMKVPRHLGIIPDGNRRWAKSRGLPAFKGHEAGAKIFREILRWCEELKIRMLTIYSLSTDNLLRPKEEVDFLMKLFERELKGLLKDKEVHEKKVRVRVIGNKELLSKKLQGIIEQLETATKEYSEYFLNFAMAYGGRQEILHAAKKISQLVKDGKLNIEAIDERKFSENLYAELPDVDLLIRTSEQRLSGFLPWQSVYSEIVFLKDKMFPELTKEDFVKVIKEYGIRERRFGK
ncbi:MAG: polyprenyl diphosphate synthase [archaeon]